MRHPEGVLSRCGGCGLVSVDPLPDPAVALATYDASYFRSDAGYRDYAGEEAIFRREFRRRLARMAAAGCRGRLVDVGCATGAFLVEAAARGYEVTGVEPVPEVAARARDRTGRPVHVGPVDGAGGAALPDASFDVVTAFDVLEHLVDPVAVLRRARGWLVPGGRVVVTVPDFGSLWARMRGRRWEMVVPREHLHYFTRETLARALAAAGFGPPAFLECGVPTSFGTIATKGIPLVGRGVEALLGPLASRGFALPFGSLFAISRAGPPQREDRRAEPSDSRNGA
jgi:SAM-dependent methyltransferase